jgi:hypothetical protein
VPPPDAWKASLIPHPLTREEWVETFSRGFSRGVRVTERGQAELAHILANTMSANSEKAVQHMVSTLFPGFEFSQNAWEGSVTLCADTGYDIACFTHDQQVQFGMRTRCWSPREKCVPSKQWSFAMRHTLFQSGEEFYAVIRSGEMCRHGYIPSCEECSAEKGKGHEG